jgi:hypothetical protein
MTVLDIVMRIVHIAAAILLGGSLAFILFGLLPNMKVLDERFRDSVTQMARRGFVRLMHAAIGLLLISGAYNWWRNVEVYNALKAIDRGQYILLQGLLGLKVLAAVTVFVVIFADGAGRLPGPTTRWLKVNVALVGLIVALGAVVRYLRLQGLAP